MSKIRLSTKEKTMLQSLLIDFESRNRSAGVIQRPDDLEFHSFAGLISTLARKKLIRILKEGEYEPRRYFTIDAPDEIRKLLAE